MPLAVEIVTPSRILVQEQVDEVNVPGEGGYMGILPGHTALLTKLGQGELMYRKGEQRQYMALFGGYMEVRDDHVTVLADVAERAAEINRARAESARDRAEQRLRNTHDHDIDYERARAALMRALVRLQVASRH
ncbi:MAG: F0F1 ATP synthase subunit epsilon [Candidatus Tectimicrobiota bacterium]